MYKSFAHTPILMHKSQQAFSMEIGPREPEIAGRWSIRDSRIEASFDEEDSCRGRRGPGPSNHELMNSRILEPIGGALLRRRRAAAWDSEPEPCGARAAGVTRAGTARVPGFRLRLRRRATTVRPISSLCSGGLSSQPRWGPGRRQLTGTRSVTGTVTVTDDDSDVRRPSPGRALF